MKKKEDAVAKQKKHVIGKIVAEIHFRSNGTAGDCAIKGSREDLLNLLINNLEHNEIFSDLMRDAMAFKVMHSLEHMIGDMEETLKAKKSSKKKVVAKKKK